jgi:hypothetical protein
VSETAVTPSPLSQYGRYRKLIWGECSDEKEEVYMGLSLTIGLKKNNGEHPAKSNVLHQPLLFFCFALSFTDEQLLLLRFF